MGMLVFDESFDVCLIRIDLMDLAILCVVG